MRHTRYIILTVFTIVAALRAFAQTGNEIVVNDIQMIANSEKNLSVSMNNVDNIVAVEFTLDVPQGFYIDPESVVLTDRAKGHQVTARHTANNRYRIVVLSTSNKPIKKTSGPLLNMTLIAEAVDDGDYPLTISDAVMAVSLGKNVIGSSTSGVVSIGHLDYQLSDIQVEGSTVKPNEALRLSWQVKNIGSLVGKGGWKENVYLVGQGGATKQIGSAYYYDELRPNSVVRREVSLDLPAILGIDGNATLRVRLIPDSESGEPTSLQANNEAASGTVTVEKRLTMSPAEIRVDEARTKSVTFYIERSGSTSGAETFDITCTDDERVTVPKQVTIGASSSSAYFQMQVTANKVYDNDSVVNITVTGNNYGKVTSRIVIEDDSGKPLHLVLDKNTYEEGDIIRLKVETDKPVDADLPIYLTIEQQKRFKMPAQTSIPTGSKSVEIEIPVIDDNLPSDDQTIELTVSADGYEPTQKLFVLNDNDVPAIDMEITPNVVSEAAGANAIHVTITRSGVTNNDITIRLSDDSAGDLFYNATITMKSGEEKAVVPIGVKDNEKVDGEREVHLTAAVYISTCDCNLSGEKQASVTKAIRILDNDGPTLSLSANKTVVLEGDEEGVMLTLSRNVVTDDVVTAVITCESAGVVLPQTVTLASRSETFKMEVPKNDVQEGNRTVNIMASAQGYSSATAWIMISDQTLPDLTVKSLYLDKDSVMIGKEYRMTMVLQSIGAAEVPARSTYTVNAAGEELTFTITDAIPVGGEHTEQLVFQAPSIPGEYDLSVWCNKSEAFEELQTINNSLSCPLKVTSPFSWTLSTDAATYQTGETVRLTGSAVSKDGTDVHLTIEPYVIYLGTRTALKATTDDDGRFDLTYQLPAGVGGDYAFGVCLPGEGLDTEMAHISVYGMALASAGYVKNHLYLNERYTVSVPIVNMSSLPLHHLKATATDEYGYYEVLVRELDELEANGTADLDIEVTSAQLPITQNWERVMIHLSSDEGATLDFPIFNYTHSREARLILGTSNINTTVTKGESRTFPVVVTNAGLGETGKITVDIPSTQNFVSMAGTEEIPSLQAGDSAVIRLKFNPSDLDVNVVQKGIIAVNCEKADGAVINYSVKVVSEDKGNLLVRVADENTFYGNASGDHPYVSDASVKIKDYSTGVEILSATTDDEGQVLFEGLNEGYYTLYVTASKHDSYTQNVLVSPGVTTEHTAAISYNAISISFDVQEVSIEDRYEISSVIVYETQVPVPVVKMETPDELDLNKVIDGGTLLYNIILQNVGLITAQNVNVSLPEADGVDFVPLAPYAGFDLAPEQTHVIPVYVCRSDMTPSNVRRLMAPKMDDDKKPKCNGDTFLGWEWACGDNGHYGWLQKPIKWLLRTCEPGTPPTPRTGKQQKPKEVILPPYPLPVEPNLWRPNKPISQVDLGAVYDVVTRVLCTLTCFAPDPIGGCLPALDGDWYKIAKTLLEFKECLNEALNKELSPYDWECLVKAATGNYNMYNTQRRRLPASNRKSLYESYMEKMNIYADIVNVFPALYADMLDAPQLEQDAETYDEVLASAIMINYDLDDLHEKGELYSQDIDQLYQKELAKMPQQKADWYDFNLRRYIERQVNTFRLKDNMSVSGTNHMSPEVEESIRDKLDSSKKALEALGFVDLDDMIEAIHEDAAAINNGSVNTCATVKLKLSQEMVLTRQAFRGTLTIENSTSGELTGISAALTATDENGKLATNHEMQITLESVDGLEADGNDWKLAANTTGTFTYLFIPTKYAAPETAMTYSFGGTLYFNDSTDVQVRSLYPVSLIVKPSPVLELTYFMQRDIYGDNPLTIDIIEPVIPAEFSVLVHNKGNGDADNVRMITHQPEVIENEKGLLVDFAIVSSSLNGAPAVMALEDDIATEFGNIAAGNCAYASWGLTSSLLGHFKDYDVSYTHVNSYDNPDLSLLGKVSIHELIHSVNVMRGDNKIHAWVTNDLVDAEETPDHIYFADGTDDDVHSLTNSATITKTDANTYRITVNTPTREWYYSCLQNPGGKYAKISSIVNETTGATLDAENFWTTDYTMLDGKDPVEEYKLHIVDLAQGAGNMRYIVTFEPMPEVILAVDEISTVPEDDEIASVPIQQLTVVFNKDVDTSTFSREDIVLRHEGTTIDTALPISRTDSRTFVVNTSALTTNGYYSFQVNTSGIKDTEGFFGSESKKVGWILLRDGIVGINATVHPVEAGEVNGVSNASYGTLVKLVTTANPGYEFVRWTVGDETISEEPILQWEANRDVNIVANYSRKTYLVTIIDEQENGTVSGAHTGIYYYGDTIQVKATANDDYVFGGWLINGENQHGEAEQTFTVNGQMSLQANFIPYDPMGIHHPDKEVQNEEYTVHTITGVLIGKKLSSSQLKQLSQGIYIINGRKFVVR